MNIGENLTKIIDVSKYSNNGTGNSLTNVLGKYGKAFDFNGVNSYISLGNPTSLQINNDFSSCVWIYKKAGAGFIFAKTDLNVNWQDYGFYSTAGNDYTSSRLITIPC